MSDTEKKSGCGCVGKGCLVLLILAVALVGFGVWSYHHWVANPLRVYTEEKGSIIELETTTREEYDQLVKKLDVFKAGTQGSDTLTLNAHDLNVLLAHSPEWQVVQGKIRADIQNDLVGLQGSLPLSAVPGLRDRYLNGEIYFTLTMNNKVLVMKLDKIKLKSDELSKKAEKSLNPVWVDYLKNRLLGDPVMGPVLIRAKTLEVKDGVITLTQ